MTLLPVSDQGNLYVLAAQLAASADLQAAVGESNATDTLEHISYPFVDFTDSGAVIADLEPPRVVIADEPGDFELTIVGIGSWMLEESFWVSFDLIPPAEVTTEGSAVNEWTWFTKTIKAILASTQQLGKTGNPVGTRSYTEVEFSKVRGPYRLDQSESGRLPDPQVSQPDTVWHIAFMATLTL